MTPEYLTPKEAAKELKRSVDVIHSMCASGELGHFRFRRSILIPRIALDEYIKANYHPAHRNFFGRRNQGPTREEVETMLRDEKPFGA